MCRSTVMDVWHLLVSGSGSRLAGRQPQHVCNRDDLLLPLLCPTFAVTSCPAMYRAHCTPPPVVFFRKINSAFATLLTQLITASLLAVPAGFPSVGKSSLLTELTGTNSEAAAYEFTTLTCIPGVIHYNDAKIQLLDLPGIIEGAAQGKGRGRQVCL